MGLVDLIVEHEKSLAKPVILITDSVAMNCGIASASDNRKVSSW